MHISGRSSDLFPFVERLPKIQRIQWQKNFKNVKMELTAAGTVQDFHLFPSIGRLEKRTIPKIAPQR
jgi:hypothetical protein